MIYFFVAYKELKKYKKPIITSCPSGNFGNICAGILAKKMGLPIDHFVAATNTNDSVPQFMKTGNFNPKPSKSTLSNAMDVGNPSNFIRIQEMYNYNLKEFKTDFSSYSFTDAETIEAIKKLNQLNYIAEPHGAIGYLGLKAEIEKQSKNQVGFFLETAHPIKFLDVVEPILKTKLTIPKQIITLLNKEKISHKIKTYDEFINKLI
jgi:threonine synthase